MQWRNSFSKASDKHNHLNDLSSPSLNDISTPTWWAAWVARFLKKWAQLLYFLINKTANMYMFWYLEFSFKFMLFLLLSNNCSTAEHGFYLAKLLNSLLVLIIILRATQANSWKSKFGNYEHKLWNPLSGSKRKEEIFFAQFLEASHCNTPKKTVHDHTL